MPEMPPLYGEDYCAILLAAGYSRRFGDANKLLHPLPDGTPLGVRAAQTLRQVFQHVIAVVNPESGELAQHYQRLGVEVLTNVFAAQGMGLSLATGIAHSPGRKGWVIALADMPFIRAETVRQVADSLAVGAPLAAPCYERQRGHPVGFSGQFEAELLALNRDRGAQGIIQRHRQSLHLLAVDDPGILHDIDTLTDLSSGSAIE